MGSRLASSTGTLRAQGLSTAPIFSASHQHEPRQYTSDVRFVVHSSLMFPLPNGAVLHHTSHARCTSRTLSEQRIYPASIYTARRDATKCRAFHLEFLSFDWFSLKIPVIDRRCRTELCRHEAIRMTHPSNWAILPSRL
jgi:hypothetical protein